MCMCTSQKWTYPRCFTYPRSLCRSQFCRSGSFSASKRWQNFRQHVDVASALFAFRHGLNVGTVGIGVWHRHLLKPVSERREFGVLYHSWPSFSKVTDGNQRYLHFVVAIVIVAAITNAIVQPFTCDRSTDMAMTFSPRFFDIYCH